MKGEERKGSCQQEEEEEEVDDTWVKVPRAKTKVKSVKGYTQLNGTFTSDTKPQTRRQQATMIFHS